MDQTNILGSKYPSVTYESKHEISILNLNKPKPSGMAPRGYFSVYIVHITSRQSKVIQF